MLYRLIEQYIRERLDASGYEEVRSPQLFQPGLWQRSGHFDHYSDNMFRVGEEMILKPMNCPAHVQIFNYDVVSHHQLPRRIAEFGCCHRNEPSGALSGMMRVRQFVQDDAHIFCSPEQIEQEIDDFCALLREVYAKFGFDDVSVALSLRPDDRAGDDALWDHSEAVLQRCLDRFGAPYRVLPGEGAFYGPKLEFSLRDRHGREWQCGTLQLDFILPERLDARYVDADNKRRVPVMIHRAILGSFERFIAILLEHHGVDLPIWVAPVQIAFVPISGEYQDLCYEIGRECGLRFEVLPPDESVSKRVRDARSRGVPFVSVVGEKELSGEMMIRHGSNQFPIARAELGRVAQR